MVYPTEGAGLQATVFSMRMVPVRLGADSRWMVNSWVPKGGSPAAIADARKSPGQALADATKPVERISPRASVAWLIVPVVLVCLVFVVPLGFLLRERRAERRMRRYLDSRASS